MDFIFGNYKGNNRNTTTRPNPRGPSRPGISTSVPQQDGGGVALMAFSYLLDPRFIAFVFIVAYINWSIIKSTVGLRLSKEGELKGTDVTETGVIAYAIRD